MSDIITEKELVRFGQADTDVIDGIFERNIIESNTPTGFDIDWGAQEVGNIPVLAHYYVKGKDMHYYVLSRVHDEEDDLLTCVNVNKGEKQLILFPVRLFNGAVLDEVTQEHAFAEEKLFGNVFLRDILN